MKAWTVRWWVLMLLLSAAGWALVAFVVGLCVLGWLVMT